MQIDQRVNSAQRCSSFDGSLQLALVLLIRQLCSFLAEFRFRRLNHSVQILPSKELPQQVTERDKTRHDFFFDDVLKQPFSLPGDLPNLFLQFLPPILQVIKQQRRPLNLGKLSRRKKVDKDSQYSREDNQIVRNHQRCRKRSARMSASVKQYQHPRYDSYVSVTQHPVTQRPRALGVDLTPHRIGHYSRDSNEPG